MDQSVIETLKRRDRKGFIQRLVCEDEEISLKDYWRGYNLKDVVYNVSDAWDEVSTETLKRSWNKLWPESTALPSDDSTETEIELLSSTAFQLNLETSEIAEWLRCDEADPGYELMDDDQIIGFVNGDDGVDSDSEIDDTEYDGGEPSEDVSTLIDTSASFRQQAKQAASNMQQYIEWYTQQNDANRIDTMLLRKFRNFAAQRSEASVKQTKLTDHFGPKKD